MPPGHDPQEYWLTRATRKALSVYAAPFTKDTVRVQHMMG